MGEATKRSPGTIRRRRRHLPVPEVGGRGSGRDLEGPDNDAAGRVRLAGRSTGRAPADRRTSAWCAARISRRVRRTRSRPAPRFEQKARVDRGADQRADRRPPSLPLLLRARLLAGPGGGRRCSPPRRRDQPMHVYAHAWLRWFRRAQRFGQSVLWMDSCMDYRAVHPGPDVPMRDELGTGMPGPAFIGSAAQTRAPSNCPMPDGQVHGVFTWTLLKGLAGAAATGVAGSRGRACGTSSTPSMPDFLPDEREAGGLGRPAAVRPGRRGHGVRRLESRPVCPVSLSMPAASGRSAN